MSAIHARWDWGLGLHSCIDRWLVELQSLVLARASCQSSAKVEVSTDLESHSTVTYVGHVDEPTSWQTCHLCHATGNICKFGNI